MASGVRTVFSLMLLRSTNDRAEEFIGMACSVLLIMSNHQQRRKVVQSKLLLVCCKAGMYHQTLKHDDQLINFLVS